MQWDNSFNDYMIGPCACPLPSPNFGPTHGITIIWGNFIIEQSENKDIKFFKSSGLGLKWIFRNDIIFQTSNTMHSFPNLGLDLELWKGK